MIIISHELNVYLPLEEVAFLIPPHLDIHHLGASSCWLCVQMRKIRARLYAPHAAHLSLKSYNPQISSPGLNCRRYRNCDSFFATFSDAPGRSVLFGETSEEVGKEATPP